MVKFFRSLALLVSLFVFAHPAEAGASKFKLRPHGGADAVCGVPAITSPAAGTSLADVCAYKTSLVTPRFAYSNGTWSGSIDAYLTSKGCSLNNVSRIWCQVTNGGSVLIEKYDFGSQSISFYGDNITITVRDSRFTGAFIIANEDANGNAQWSQTVTLNLDHNDMNGNFTSNASVYLDSGGTFEESFDFIRNQGSAIWFASNGKTSVQNVNIHDNYITGGGADGSLGSGVHVETIQYFPLTGSTFIFNRNFVNLIDGQGVSDAGWTGYFSIDDTSVVISNNIFRGFIAANAANVSNPNRICCIFAYNARTITAGATMTNNAMEIGVFGYTITDLVGTPLPTDGGGNRTYTTNVAITDLN